jgi:serine/threonine protein kinase
MIFALNLYVTDLKIMQIGQGAYGDVWLAEDIQNNRLVALKKLRFGEEREGVSFLSNRLKNKTVYILVF